MWQVVCGQRHRLRRLVMFWIGVRGCTTFASEQLEDAHGLQ